MTQAKFNELLHATAWMNLTTIMMNKTIQSQYEGQKLAKLSSMVKEVNWWAGAEGGLLGCC